MRGFSPVAGLLLALSGSALATGSDRDPAKAAQDVALARLAPTVCDDVRTDAEAVRSFMDRAGVGEADLTGRYAAAIRIAVRRFRDAADQDEDAACSRLVRRLGQEGIGIVDEVGMGEP